MEKTRNKWKLGSVEMLTASPTERQVPVSMQASKSCQIRVLADAQEKKDLALAIELMELIIPTLLINILPAARSPCSLLRMRTDFTASFPSAEINKSLCSPWKKQQQVKNYF